MASGKTIRIIRKKGSLLANALENCTCKRLSFVKFNFFCIGAITDTSVKNKKDFCRETYCFVYHKHNQSAILNTVVLNNM